MFEGPNHRWLATNLSEPAVVFGADFFAIVTHRLSGSRFATGFDPEHPVGNHPVPSVYSSIGTLPTDELWEPSAGSER